jgi:hypothetical protein
LWLHPEASDGSLVLYSYVSLVRVSTAAVKSNIFQVFKSEIHKVPLKEKQDPVYSGNTVVTIATYVLLFSAQIFQGLGAA